MDLDHAAVADIVVEVEGDAAGTVAAVARAVDGAAVVVVVGVVDIAVVVEVVDVEVVDVALVAVDIVEDADTR